MKKVNYPCQPLGPCNKFTPPRVRPNNVTDKTSPEINKGTHTQGYVQSARPPMRIG